jgi:hypothetical protein
MQQLPNYFTFQHGKALLEGIKINCIFLSLLACSPFISFNCSTTGFITLHATHLRSFIKCMQFTAIYHCSFLMLRSKIATFDFRFLPCFFSRSHFEPSIFSCTSKQLHNITKYVGTHNVHVKNIKNIKRIK